MTWLSDILLAYFTWAQNISQAIVDYYVSNSRDFIDYLHVTFEYLFSGGLYIASFISLIFLLLSVVSLAHKKKKPIPITDEEAPILTVHIPTRNEIVALECAKRCLESDYPQDKLQILIGDDSDKPNISRQLQEFAGKYDNVDVIAREENVGYKPGNLNNMMDYTKGEFIAIFDSDFLPGPTFLRDIVTPMVRDDTLHAVQGRWNPYNADQSYSAIAGAFIVDVFHHVALPVAETFFGTAVLGGSAECVRTSKLEELGRWKSGAFTEDTEYSMRLLRNGHRVEYASYAPCDCEVPFTPKDLYLQQMRWAYGNATALYEHLRGIVYNFFTQHYAHARASMYTTCLIMLGYIFGFMVLYLTTTGFLSFITHPIGPIDIPLFFSQTGWNIILTSGLVIISTIAFLRSGRGKLLPKGYLSLYTIGIITTVYVNIGIWRALTGRDMKWYLLSKGGSDD